MLTTVCCSWNTIGLHSSKHAGFVVYGYLWANQRKSISLAGLLIFVCKLQQYFSMDSIDIQLLNPNLISFFDV